MGFSKLKVRYTEIILSPRGIAFLGLYGVSVTHGRAGSRQHIWSFAMARFETDTDPLYLCPCIQPDVTWPYQIHPFIGNNYFCDTGNRGPSSSATQPTLMTLCEMVQGAVLPVTAVSSTSLHGSAPH